MLHLEHQPKGTIHTLDKEMIECSFDVATKHDRKMSIEDQQMLQTQRKEKLRRQELKKQDGLDKVEKKLIESRLWAEKHESLAWKNSREVAMKLRKINGVTNKLKELKFQMNIRDKDFNFNDVLCSFSSGGKQKTVDELSTLLKDIIRSMQGTTFEWPETTTPERKVLLVIGTMTPDVVACDARQRTMKEKLKVQAIDRRRQQELSGDADNFANLQSATAPEPQVGMRIDMLFN